MFQREKLVKNKDEKKLTESVSKNVKNQLKSTNQIKEKLINEPSLSSVIMNKFTHLKS